MGVATKSSTSQNPIYCGEAPDAGVAVGTINELADALASRRISASTLLEQIIKRIEALDTRLNAVVVRDFERAREAAHAADIALSQGERRPLLGIPFTVKEAINVAGLPTTWGFPEFKDFIPKEDALITSRAKRAGAVLLGKTNVPLGLGDFRATTTSTGRPTILGMSAAPLEVLPAAALPRLPPALDRCRLGRTSGDRCASRLISAVFTRTSRVLVLSRFGDTTGHRGRRCRSGATLV